MADHQSVTEAMHRIASELAAWPATAAPVPAEAAMALTCAGIAVTRRLVREVDEQDTWLR